MDAAAQLIIHDTFPFLDFWSRHDQTPISTAPLTKMYFAKKLQPFKMLM